MGVKISKMDIPIKISENDKVRLKTTGNISEIMHSQRKSSGSPIRKLDKDHYYDIRSGEVSEFEHIENRSDDKISVARSLAMGRDLLNSNITDVSKCRWITLTYAENMTDPMRLKDDFKEFNRRCRKKYGHYEYITAAEPQGRGAWHLHCVFIFTNKAPYMENSVVRQLWGQGFVTVKKLDDVDNVGAYLTAYLGDLDLDEKIENNINIDGKYTVKTIDYEENGEKKSKKYIKGGRLHMYPPGFHIFRWSMGIVKPCLEYINYSDAKKKVSAGTLTYQKVVSLVDDENGFSNQLSYEYYNQIRDKSQAYIPIEPIK